jgi:hypothetical protein
MPEPTDVATAKTNNTYLLRVDYGIMPHTVLAGENYDVSSPDRIWEMMVGYLENRKVESKRYEDRRGVAILHVRLAVPPDKEIAKQEEVEREMLEPGERFMDLLELLHFGVQHPTVQLTECILAIDLYYYNGWIPKVPCLSSGVFPGERVLDAATMRPTMLRRKYAIVKPEPTGS